MTCQVVVDRIKQLSGGRMVGKIEIEGKKYSQRTVEILSGVKNYFELNANLLLIAEVIENPYDFPFLLEDIYDMDFDEDLRLALVRIQIDSKMHMCDDLEAGQIRLYIAETIEKMLFGELLLEGDEKGIEIREKEKKDKDKAKGKAKGGAKGKGGGGKGKGKGGGGKGKGGGGKGKGKGGGGKGKGKGGGGKGKDKGKGKGKRSKKEDDEKKDWKNSYA